MDFATSFASIMKMEKNEDGTLLVYGKATDDTLDLDQQVCDPTWLDSAMPQWFKTGGNVREMHTASAAGVATEYAVKDDGHYITALVVDPLAVKKVEHGVYTGFSIGIRSPRVVRDNKAANGRIVDGQIVEVSLVDRPANPAAKFVMAKSVDGELVKVEEIEDSTDSPVGEKRAFSDEHRQAAAERGHALSDGSFPIETVKDLENAIQSFGRAKDPAAAKKHIIDRARALGAVDKLPESWGVKKMSEPLDGVKSLLAEIKKFDQQAYEQALEALSNLVSVEAQEMAQGEDEIDSIKELLDAIKHLNRWYEGEVEEGEVPGVTPDADSMSDMLDDVQDALGLSVEATVTKTAESATIPEVEESVTSVEDGEAATLKAALEAAEAKAAGLEAQLADVLQKAATGGPKRTGKTSSKSLNDIQVQAAVLMQKAAATTDPMLQQGYRERANDLLEQLSVRKDD